MNHGRSLLWLLSSFLASTTGEHYGHISGVARLSDEQSSILSTQKCDADSEERVNICLKPILSYANSIQQETENAPIGLQAGEIFHKLCYYYHEFKDCARPNICDSISVRAIDASYGFMCGEGFKLFEEHASCFAEIENEPEYTHCKRAASRSMDDASTLKRTDLGKYFVKLCGVMNDYLGCCRPHVNAKCGVNAWRLVAQVTMDSLQVTMPNCDISRVLS